MTRIFHRTRPPVSGDYTAFIGRSALFFFAAGVGYVAYTETDSRYAAVVMATGVFGLLMTMAQKRAYDRHVWLAADPIIIDDEEPEPPVQGQQLNVLTDNGVKWGVFLPPAHWVKLAGLALRNGNTFSKAMCIKYGIKKAGIMNQQLRGWHEVGVSGQNATVWTDFCHYLEVQGLIKPVQRNQPNELTELGIAEFRKLARGNSPTPQRSERQNATPTTYVTADFDGENEIE